MQNNLKKLEKSVKDPETASNERAKDPKKRPIMQKLNPSRQIKRLQISPFQTRGPKPYSLINEKYLTYKNKRK